MNADEPGKMVSVLLVDDDPEDVEIACRAFEKGKIANPLYIVRDGDEAMEFLKHSGRYADPARAPRPGLILLDLNLPRLDGREVLKLIKNDSNLDRIPVVVFTTSSEEADVLRCYDSGANTYVTKPLEFDKFLEAVSTIGQYWLSIAETPNWGQRRRESGITDELTYIANRRHLMRKLEEEVIHSGRTGHLFALLMIDLDYFKQFNGQYEHQKGDEVLRQYASALKGSLRSTDFAARYGDEEFCVLLPETPSPGAQVVAQRLRQAAEALPDPVPAISIGVALWEPHSLMKDVLERAKEARRKAKEAGRDRVTVYGE